MEPVFKTKTKCTYKEYKKFYKAGLKSHHLDILVIILEISFLIASLILKKTIYLLEILLFPIFFYIFIRVAIKKEFNSNKAIQNIDSEFAFYEDYFEEKTKYGEEKIQYEMLHRIIETKENMYLMIGKSQGYILVKKEMPKELVKFIKGKVDCCNNKLK